MRDTSSEGYKFYANILTMLDKHKSSQKESEGGRKQDIAVRLKVYRNKKDLTQNQLAVELNVSLRQVARWEKAQSLPSNLALEKMKQLGII